MGKKILIATAQDILCAGLKAIFLDDMRVSEIFEVRSKEDLHIQLALHMDLDILVVSQAMISDMALLPRHRFVVLTAEPDLTLMRMAYDHGARGYISRDISADMLRILLGPMEKKFLVDPLLAGWVMHRLFHVAPDFASDVLIAQMPPLALDTYRREQGGASQA